MEVRTEVFVQAINQFINDMFAKTELNLKNATNAIAVKMYVHNKLGNQLSMLADEKGMIDVDFLEDITKEEFSFFLTDKEAKDIVDKMENESREHPKGERWDKETTLKVFSDAGHPLSNERYSENGVYWAMNMVYSDFFPMYKDDVSKYIEHAYLFLNDKDYSGKYAKEKWYAKKRA